MGLTFSLYPLCFSSEDLTKLHQSMNMNEWDMKEAYAASKNISNSYQSSIISYMAGNCWINAKISNNNPIDLQYDILKHNDRPENMPITKYDVEMVENLKMGVKQSTPLSYPINLFHGFEPFTRYHTENFSPGTIIHFRHALSKTPKYAVAQRFAIGVNPYISRYLYVCYPPRSQHICLDVFDRRKDEASREYEHLSINETLKVSSILCKIQWRLPYISLFYVMKPL